jgi:hypothetical protein
MYCVVKLKGVLLLNIVVHLVTTVFYRVAFVMLHGTTDHTDIGRVIYLCEETRVRIFP